MSQLPMLQESFYKPIHQNFVKLADEKAFKREVGFAIQIIKGNTALQKCDANSVLEAIYNISQTGLTLNPVLNYAYLIPRKGKCCLDPGYQGLIKLATDTDNITSINVQLVYQGDEVEIDLATDQKILKHIPYQLTGKEQGPILYGYSVATLQDGTKHVEIMSLKQIYEIRDYSESYKYEKDKPYKNSPWFKNEPEMCRKTIIRRHFKYLPKSDNKRLEKAIELDNQDYDFPATYEQGNIIEGLLMSAAIPEKVEREIYRTLHDNQFTQKRAQECIEYLEANQADHIDGAKNYNQGDIQKKLAQMKEQ